MAFQDMYRSMWDMLDVYYQARTHTFGQRSVDDVIQKIDVFCAWSARYFPTQSGIIQSLVKACNEAKEAGKVDYDSNDYFDEESDGDEGYDNYETNDGTEDVEEKMWELTLALFSDKSVEKMLKAMMTSIAQYIEGYGHRSGDLKGFEFTEQEHDLMIKLMNKAQRVNIGF